MGDLRMMHTGDAAGTVRRRGRRLDTYAVAIGGGLFANVANGRVVGFGIEPVGPVLHAGPVPKKRHLALALAAPIGAAAAAGAAVAAGLVLRHRSVA